MKKVFFLMIAAIGLLVACGKDESSNKTETVIKEKKTELIVVTNYDDEVANFLGYPKKIRQVSAVEVFVYKSKEEAEKTSNSYVAKGKTDEKGEVKFDNLEEGNYYIKALSDNCYSNYNIELEKVELKKDYTPTYHQIFLIQHSRIEVTNKLTIPIYVRLDLDTERTLVAPAKTVGFVVRPEVVSNFTTENYYKHTLEVYKDQYTLVSPFKVLDATTNKGCKALSINVNW